MKVKHVIIPIFIPHKGCPFDCIYCNQKKISGQAEEITITKMKEIIESHISSSLKDTFLEIGFFGGSFTGIDKREQISFLESANEYVKSGLVRGIRLSTRPDYINEDILEYLKKFNVKIIELGVQSLDEVVLKVSNRGHTRKDVETSVKLIKSYGFELGIQTMIGLPGDSQERDMDTANIVIGLSPDIVRIYPTLVIKDTYLEELMKKGEYIPLTLEEAVETSSKLLELYEKNNVKVIRIGLQPTDTINEGFDVTAGPFHPAFRQLCEARIGLKTIIKQIEEKKLNNEKSIIIYTGARNIDNVVGQKKGNIKRLKEKYGFLQIDIKTDPTLEKKIIVSKL